MVERPRGDNATAPGVIGSVRFEPLDPAFGLREEPGGDATHAVQLAVDVPARVAFHAAAPRPLPPTAAAEGVVTLFLDADETACLAANAALAVLLQTPAAAQDRLLVEVSDSFAVGASEPSRLLTKISTARVWRTGVAASGGRLRDWVLLLQECRSAYNSTAVAVTGADTALHQRLASLVDRTVIVSRAGRWSLEQAHSRLRRLREQGVRRCECLWLDAA